MCWNGEYHVTQAFVDGMGRTVATLPKADPDATYGDGYPWAASVSVEYDRTLTEATCRQAS